MGKGFQNPKEHTKSEPRTSQTRRKTAMHVKESVLPKLLLKGPFPTFASLQLRVAVVLDLSEGLVCAWTPCELDPCANNATCSDLPGAKSGSGGDFNCSCATGFAGRRCEVDLQRCRAESCGQRGSCIFDTNWTQSCVCNSGWTGQSKA